MDRPIYLDYHATTPVDNRVLEIMWPYFQTLFGNAGSANHRYGWEADAAVKRARVQIADTIAADPSEIIFTSGATEANNLAIKGVAEAYLSKGRHLITVATEHRAVLDPCGYLEGLGFEITRLGVQENGLLDLTTLEQAIREDTVLVSVMAANNEIGVLQPLEAIGKLCHDRSVLFHTDAAQAAGKIPLHVQKQHLDLMSLTAHKLYGPKGIGALYVRRKHPRVQLAAQLHGGGQERGWRSGTLSVPLIVGFGEALALSVQDMDNEQAHLLALRHRLWEGLQSLDGLVLNGHYHQRLAGNLNVSVMGVRGNALLQALGRELALSSGSACSTQRSSPSHVLTALGRDPDQAKASLRFGLGRFTTETEIDQALAKTIATIQDLRSTRI